MQMDTNTTIDALVLRVGSLLLLAVGGWCLLGIVAALVVRVAGRRGRAPALAELVARLALPRWAYALLAGSAVILTPLAARADPVPTLPPPALPVSTAASTPTAAAVPYSAESSKPHPALPSTPAATVVVRPGDTLWRLAATHLGKHPAELRIAAAWPRWYAANRAVIGSDPSLIQPGERLHTPQERP